MKNSRDILTDILKTAQTSQTGIRSVLDISMRPGLRKALEAQLREYDRIESEAHAIATQRGWELKEIEPAARFWMDVTTRMKLTRGNCDSKIADIMIQDNTRAMIRGLKNIHQSSSQDQQICTISQKLLDCETANIRQLQGFL